jgi:hypothetical protein
MEEQWPPSARSRSPLPEAESEQRHRGEADEQHEGSPANDCVYEVLAAHDPFSIGKRSAPGEGPGPFRNPRPKPGFPRASRLLFGEKEAIRIRYRNEERKRRWACRIRPSRIDLAPSVRTPSMREGRAVQAKGRHVHYFCPKCSLGWIVSLEEAMQDKP